MMLVAIRDMRNLWFKGPFFVGIKLIAYEYLFGRQSYHDSSGGLLQSHD